MKKYDRFVTRRYLINALRRGLADTVLRPKIVEWIGRSEDELAAIDAGFLFLRFQELRLGEAEDTEHEFGFGSRRRRSGRRPGTRGNSASASRAKKFALWAIEALDESVAKPPSAGPEARATALAVRRFDLDGVCGPLLELTRLHDSPRSPARYLWDATNDGLDDSLEASGILLGVSRGRIERALRRLTEVGIADPDCWSGKRSRPRRLRAGLVRMRLSPSRRFRPGAARTPRSTGFGAQAGTGRLRSSG